MASSSGRSEYAPGCLARASARLHALPLAFLQAHQQYVGEPLRLSYADGGVYLTAWVSEYGEMWHFAAERIETLAVLDDRFDPRPLPTEPFANSLGVHSGPPERVEIELDASAADYVTTREWHRSQTFEAQADGSVVMRLDVSIDRALRSWVLGFGAAARVIAPERLAQEIFEQIEDVRERYMPRLAVEMVRVRTDAGTGAAKSALSIRTLWRAS